MKKIIRTISFFASAVTFLAISGCTTTPPPPLTYLAVERPAGPIKGGGRSVETKHSKNGMYFLNAGFRPASDVTAYVQKAHQASGSDMLTNADVELNIPFAFDIFFFGFQFGSDTVRVK